MQGVILNTLANHVQPILTDMRYEFLEVQNVIVDILDAFARYKTGERSDSISLSAMLNRNPAFFYGTGTDQRFEVPDNLKTARFFPKWKKMYADVPLDGDTLKAVHGVNLSEIIEMGVTENPPDRSTKYKIGNYAYNSMTATAAGLADKKLASTHGHYQMLDEREEAWKPESLDDMFNPTGDWHGVAPEGLESWDSAHVFGRNPISNVNNAGAITTDTSANPELLYRNRPQVYQFADNTEPSITNLDPILRRYGQVVGGLKLGYCDADLFSTLAADYRDKNRMILPTLEVGGFGWSYEVDHVNIAGTDIICEPQAKPNVIRVLHLGTRNADNGTVFPYYYDPSADESDYIKMKAAMLTMNPDMRPKGKNFGVPRPTPYHVSEWDRASSQINAGMCSVYLDSIPVCGLRGFQLELRFPTS